MKAFECENEVAVSIMKAKTLKRDLVETESSLVSELFWR